LQKHWANSTAH